MSRLEDRELRLIRYILNHKEIGSKAAVFSISEAAEYLKVSEEDIVKMLDSLKAKGMIKPLMINISPQVYLRRMELLNQNYAKGNINKDEYMRSWREIEDELGIEAVSYLPISLVELGEHLKAIKDTSRLINELGSDLNSDIRDEILRDFRSRMHLHYKVISEYLSFCVWRAKRIYFEVLRSGEGREDALNSMAAYLYLIFPNVIRFTSSMPK